MRAIGRAIPPPGQLYDVGETSLHLRRFGDGERNTVLLEAGGARAMSSWWGWVVRRVRNDGTVASYDRAGLGWSLAVSGDVSAQAGSERLRTLIHRSALPTPVILVAHSLGALHARVFTAQYPDLVAALVLVDPTHPDQVSRLGVPPPGSRQLEAHVQRIIAAATVPALFHWACRSLVKRTPLGQLPPQDATAAAGCYLTTRHLSATAAEGRAWKATVTQAAHVDQLGVPVTIISGSVADPGWLVLQAEHLSLSSDSRHVVVAGASHDSLLLNDAHADEVAQLVAAVREEVT
jgi:pimeloyl-ACP methyl ester carboxylesterase